VLGGGPGGYEAALVATELGAEVTIIDRDGLGGACVLTDCVPSKTLIATSDLLTGLGSVGSLGVRVHTSEGTPTVASWDDDQPLCPPDVVDVDAATVFGRVKALALSQSMDIARRLAREGVRVVPGAGRLVSPREIVVTGPDGGDERVQADVVLISTGATPRAIDGSPTDGERNPHLARPLRPARAARAPRRRRLGCDRRRVRIGLPGPGVCGHAGVVAGARPAG